ncbi:MAG: hypothetical protein ACJ8DH_12920 [Microvirga sp.]
MAEPDNIVLVHLRDLRADMNARFDAMESRFEAIEKRLEMMHANGMKALKSFIGIGPCRHRRSEAAYRAA